MEQEGPSGDRESESLQDWRNYDPPAVNELLAAAISVFLDVGYHGATMRTIAANSPLSVPGIYHHYRTKQELLVAIFDATVEDLVWRVEAAIEEAGDDPVNRFTLLIECWALFHANRRDLAFIVISEFRSMNPVDRTRLDQMQTNLTRLVYQAVEDAAGDGRFKTPFPHDAARAAIRMCTAIARWYQFGGELGPEDVARQYVHFALALVEYSPRPTSRRTKSEVRRSVGV
jgi:AcrR family transcriptional regulator